MVTQTRLLFATLIGLIFLSLLYQQKIETVQFFFFGLDFNDFFSAAQVFSTGGDPYSVERFVTPPLSLLHALVLLPLGLDRAAHVFFVVNIALIAGTLLYSARRLALPSGTTVNLLLFAFAAFPVQMLIERGNLDGVVFPLLAACLFCTNPIVVGFSFTIACSLKIYPAILFPLLLMRHGKPFLLSCVGSSLGTIALFPRQMTEYIPHLLGRMGAVRFAENISPHGLARAFQQQIGFGWSEKAGALINKSFYAYALPYVAYNLALDYKAYRVGFLSRPETFAVIAASYLPAMLFFPSLVYAYSGIVLLLLFAVLESRPAATLIPNSLRFFLPVLEVGAAFNAVAYALMTNDVHFHAIPQFAVAALSLCAVLVKRRLLAADADVDATAASKATVSWNVRNRPNDQHHYRQPGRVNHGTALPDG